MVASLSEQVEILYRTYKEDQAYRADDLEPCERSENIIFHADGLKWHVKVTLRAKFGITKRSGLLMRRKKLEALICLKDFRSIPLPPDTVSELVIERASCPFRSPKLPMKPVSQLDSTQSSEPCWVYTIHEDASRVLYPVYNIDPGLPTMTLPEIQVKEQISNNVFLITGNGTVEKFIYETVERPFYKQNYTAVFQQELQNIMLLQGFRNFVQLVAVVKSPSPFKTAPLKYYPNGTLENVIHRRDGKGIVWKSWPYQLARALLRFHDSAFTHMDIAPRNVVIDAAGEAVFIDIGVGYTYENLAPEFRNDSSPLDLPCQQRCQNDCWAFGKNEPSGAIIRAVGEELSCEPPEDRLDIPEAIRQLPRY
ncbi:kinase-like protein [Aspergillus carlsbadensis]|nr:kinase-like protein [Aspergillus carlsbadensis]